MNKCKMFGVALLGVSLYANAALADDRPFDQDGYYHINAKVVRVEPMVSVVQIATPREVCWNQEVRHVETIKRRHSHSALPIIVGGVVGGVLGNQVGRQPNRDTTTLVGTVIGAAVGHQVGRQHHHPRTRTYVTNERHCETQTQYHEEERVDGYAVTYRYHGRQFTTYTDHDPGKRIRVRVQVEPSDEMAYDMRSTIW